MLRSCVSPESDLALQARVARIFASIPPAAMGLRPLKLAVLAASTMDHLVDVLRFWLATVGVEAQIHVAPFGTVEQTVLDPDSPLYRFQPQLVWLFSTHRDVDLPLKPGAGADEVRKAVDRAIEQRAVLWRTLASRLACLVLQNDADQPADDPFGHMAGAVPWGRRAALRLYNARLAAAAPAGVVVFDLDHLASLWGLSRWIDPRHWFHSKHAFALDATGWVASHAARVIAAVLGLSRKCLVLDLDNTLWGGVIGDDGLAGITLGAKAEGEAFVAFQRHIKALRERGVILAVCSKNELETARAPFRDHPDMVLRLDDIAVFCANWNDKVANLREIASTLSIGLDALVFVDDNPVERDFVRQSLPMVEVIEMPEDPAFYVEALARSGVFEATSFSAEDRARADSYASDARRFELRESCSDLDSYLETLRMRATIGEADDLNVPRIAQLINKSNQFHLTGTRLSEAQILDLRRRSDHRIASFRLADRFGDNGLISAVILRRHDRTVHIDTWVMSCRVLGRTMEEFVANEILRVALDWGCDTLLGRYVASPKNGLVAGLFERLGFESLSRSDSETTWTLATRGAVPRWKTRVQHASLESHETDRVPEPRPRDLGERA